MTPLAISPVPKCSIAVRLGTPCALSLAAFLILLMGPLSGRNAFGSEVLSFDRTYAYPVGANAKGFSANDCDGDGVVDMVAAGQNSNEVTILRNVGGGGFEFGGGNTHVSQPTGAACADFNGDGLIDFAAASRLGNIDIFKRNPGGDFTLMGSRPAGVAPASLTSGDLNNDGLLDLVGVASTSEDITVIINTGSDTLPPFSRIGVPIRSPHAAAIADFNLDGRADIAVAATFPYVVVLFGDGVGFAPRTDSVPSPFQQTKRPPKGLGIAAGDINSDGKPDIALLSSDSVITLYLGTGTGTVHLSECVRGRRRCRSDRTRRFRRQWCRRLGPPLFRNQHRAGAVRNVPGRLPCGGRLTPDGSLQRFWAGQHPIGPSRPR